MIYKERTLKFSFTVASENFKVILLTGPRQVGKTTFLRGIAGAERSYVTLDNPKDLALARNEPDLFFQTYPPPVLIDEIQYAPSLFPYIKMLADNSETNGLVWMTGSQRFELMANVTESLAGRIHIMEMQGFSMYERDGAANQKPFLGPLSDHRQAGVLTLRNLADTYEIIWRGSYPGLLNMAPGQEAAFFDDYLRTYIERDVRQIVNISSLTDFVRFISVAATRTAQELNIADIARNVDVAPNTAKQWLSVLEATGLIYLLKPYFKNIAKRLIKKPKLYFMDTGLAAHLASWSTPVTLEKGAMSGSIFETFVVSEILKSYWHNNKKPSVYYYREASGVEVDLLLEQDGKLYPAEIKKTANPSPSDAAAFTKMSESLNVEIGHGTVICLTDRPRPLTPTTTAISVWNM